MTNTANNQENLNRFWTIPFQVKYNMYRKRPFSIHDNINMYRKVTFAI